MPHPTKASRLKYIQSRSIPENEMKEMQEKRTEQNIKKIKKYKATLSQLPVAVLSGNVRRSPTI